MSTEPSKRWSWVWFAMLATTLGGLAGVGSFVHDIWPKPPPAQSSSPAREGKNNEGTVTGDRRPEKRVEGLNVGEGTQEDNDRAQGLERPLPPPRREVPLELSLADGEQKAVFSGQAALAARFTHVGGRLVPTLEIDDKGPDRGPHALLGSGSGRFELHAAGKTYAVTVLRVDVAARRIDVRIDPR